MEKIPEKLVWQAALKKTKVKLDFLTDIDMLLMVEKDIRRGICRSIYRYAKANNKYMHEITNYIKLLLTAAFKHDEI